MNSRICDSVFVKCSLTLHKLEQWINGDFLPVLCLASYLLIVFSPIYQPLFVVYTCLKWKVAIIFWLSYFLWTAYDSKTLNGEGRKIHCFKYWIVLRGLRRYFPLHLIKVADLPPDRNYLLACFPHGVIPFGCGANFCTNANNVAELFPDIDIRIATVGTLFLFPLAREFFMALGCEVNSPNSSSFKIRNAKRNLLHQPEVLYFQKSVARRFCTPNKENISNLLNSKPAKAVAIYPGGNKESLLSHPGNVYRIVKTNRKGFIKVALESGSPMVPVFSFGEQNTLDQEPFKSPIILSMMNLSKKLCRTEANIIKGRGYSSRSYGLLPHRRPVTTVVGQPIEVPKVENPSAELVDEYHEKFYTALQDLFEKYKYEYGEGDAAQLVMV